MEVEKVIHEGWKELKEAGSKFNFLGKYQYIYSSDKGKISLVMEKKIFSEKKEWEIFCLEGDLFKGTQRFSSKESAEKKIKEYLD